MEEIFEISSCIEIFADDSNCTTAPMPTTKLFCFTV